MLQEQKDRIIQIVENIEGLSSGVSIVGLTRLPDTTENFILPACLVLPRPVSYSRIDAHGFIATVTWELHLYIRAIGVGSQTQADSEPLLLLDSFASAFLTRPQLQFNGNDLQGIVNNLEFANTQNLSDPIFYPPRNSQGSRYWGAIFTIKLAQHQTHSLNESGA